MIKKNFKKLEIFLILFSSLLILFSFYSLFFESILDQYGFQNNLKRKETIGRVLQKKGILKKQSYGTSNFVEIKDQELLHHFDVILTANQESTAELELKNGTKILLDPNTMVRISLLNSLFPFGQKQPEIIIATGSIDAITKKEPLQIRTKNEIISLAANVQKKIKQDSPHSFYFPVNELKNQSFSLPPVPKNEAPSPLKKRELSPNVPPKEFGLKDVERSPKFLEKWDEKKSRDVPIGEILKETTKLLSPAPIWVPPVVIEKVLIDSNGFIQNQQLKKKVSIFLKSEKKVTSFLLTVFQKEEENKIKRFEKNLTIIDLQTAVAFYVDQPGFYEYAVTSIQPQEEGEKEIVDQFFISQEIQQLKILPPLIAGEPLTSNQLLGKILKDFDVTLRWEKNSNASDYLIQFLKDEKSNKIYFQKQTSEESYTFKKKSLSGKLFYRIVSIPKKNQYQVTTGVQSFDFDFLPPVQHLPKNEAQLNLEAILKKDKGKVLLTWQKTNFTQEYEIEMSEESTFKHLILSQKTKENFYFFPVQKESIFFWRVRSHGVGIVSPYSMAFRFEIHSDPGLK